MVRPCIMVYRNAVRAGVIMAETQPPKQKKVRIRDVMSNRFRGDDIAADITGKYGFKGDLLDIYTSIQGALVHKWHHYIPIYDRYFSRFRNSNVRMLEIGVSKGGSLQMWRRYFGTKAIIYGIDINPKSGHYDGPHAQVRIGSQDDEAFLCKVIEEMGGVDIVLDDGSHQMAHIRASLAILFPQLAENGCYMIEDLHTAYLPRFGGRQNGRGNFFRDLLPMIDDMHHWYHNMDEKTARIGQMLRGLHVHDSIVVLEKGLSLQPVHSKVGS